MLTRTWEVVLPNPDLSTVNTLAFDIFGTVLNLSDSLTLPTDRFLKKHGAAVDANSFWSDWRSRQRIEQYQDNLLMLGHSGYLETCRRALIYCLRLHGVQFTYDDVEQFMEVYQGLQPYPDAVEGLAKLSTSFHLVALSNGEQGYLEHLVENNICVEFSEIISVAQAGVFKPHPAVYRTAAKVLGREPAEIMIVAAHSFDIMGARACGFRGAYVNRYGLPMEETPYLPDLEVADFLELAAHLVS